MLNSSKKKSVECLASPIILGWSSSLAALYPRPPPSWDTQSARPVQNFSGARSLNSHLSLPSSRVTWGVQR